MKMDTVFMDWTSMYFEAPRKGWPVWAIPGITGPIGRRLRSESMDRGSGMPMGLTVNAGTS